MDSFLIDAGLWISYILIGIATLATIVFPVIYMVQHPQDAKKALMAIGGLIVVFLIGYFIASDGAVMDTSNNVLAEGTVSQLSGAGIIMFYILGGVAVIALIYSEVSNLFK